jgi:hypothetical protein
LQSFQLTFALAVAAALIGCGGAEGIKNGASTQPTVVVKRETSGGAPAANATAQAKGAAPAAATAGGGSGTLKGKVVFKGDPPKLAPLYEKGAAIKEAICVKEHAIPNEKLVIGEGNGVANVFIYLPKAPPGAAVPPPPDKPAIFDQKDCRFTPRAIVVRAGQTVKVLNSDSVAHNTHTLPQRQDGANLPISPHNQTGLDIVYKKPEAKPVDVKCDIHAWMRAHHLPLDHPWGTVSGANGEFEIKDIPAGTHKFQVWHDGAVGQFLERNLSVTIKPGEVTTIEIPYEASKFEP